MKHDYILLGVLGDEWTTTDDFLAPFRFVTTSFKIKMKIFNEEKEYFLKAKLD